MYTGQGKGFKVSGGDLPVGHLHKAHVTLPWGTYRSIHGLCLRACASKGLRFRAWGLGFRAQGDLGFADFLRSRSKLVMRTEAACLGCKASSFESAVPYVATWGLTWEVYGNYSAYVSPKWPKKARFPFG